MEVRAYRLIVNLRPGTGRARGPGRRARVGVPGLFL